MTKSVIIFFCFLLCAFNAKAQGDSTMLYKENKAPLTVKMDRKEFNLNRLHIPVVWQRPLRRWDLPFGRQTRP